MTALGCGAPCGWLSPAAGRAGTEPASDGHASLYSTQRAWSSWGLEGSWGLGGPPDPSPLPGLGMGEVPDVREGVSRAAAGGGGGGAFTFTLRSLFGLMGPTNGA